MSKKNEWPKTRLQQVAFLQARISQWAASAAEIGLEDNQVSELGTMLTAVAANMAAAENARSIAKAKTQVFYTSADPLAAMASGLMKTIRAFAITSGDPEVYELALLEPPATPSPAPAPAEPTEIRTIVENDGSIQITWKAKNARPSAGTAFNIFRKLAGQTSYFPIGTVGVRAFTDNTVPPGTPSIQYIIRGIRGDKTGPFSEPVTVYLGKASFDGAGGEGLTLAA
jgi:hypothetical protein